MTKLEIRLFEVKVATIILIILAKAHSREQNIQQDINMVVTIALKT